MYPILFKIFGFPISSFGVMMAIAFLVAAWIVGLRLREYGIDPEHASTILLYAMGGGILGSKLYFAVDMHLRTGQPFLALLLSRAGITWYGGLIGGTLAVVLGSRIHRIPTRLVANCVAVAAPFGQAIGRIGCFLVGDDYGRQTSVPWGVAFPKGSPPIDVPVHPTQLYEMVWLVAVGALLWRRRKRSPFLFGEYLALAGFGRILVEILRRNPRVALGLTEPQWIGIGLIVLGVAGWLYYRGKPEPVSGEEGRAREEVPTR
jgi:phosphatidylglycerol:prolipoprotein diacylglycerol transferase